MGIFENEQHQQKIKTCAAWTGKTNEFPLLAVNIITRGDSLNCPSSVPDSALAGPVAYVMRRP